MATPPLPPLAKGPPPTPEEVIKTELPKIKDNSLDTITELEGIAKILSKSSTPIAGRSSKSPIAKSRVSESRSFSSSSSSDDTEGANFAKDFVRHFSKKIGDELEDMTTFFGFNFGKHFKDGLVQTIKGKGAFGTAIKLMFKPFEGMMKSSSKLFRSRDSKLSEFSEKLFKDKSLKEDELLDVATKLETAKGEERVNLKIREQDLQKDIVNIKEDLKKLKLQELKLENDRLQKLEDDAKKIGDSRKEKIAQTEKHDVSHKRADLTLKDVKDLEDSELEILKFESGTKGVLGNLFADFGDGTPVILHGKEAVIPENSEEGKLLKQYESSGLKQISVGSPDFEIIKPEKDSKFDISPITSMLESINFNIIQGFSSILTFFKEDSDRNEQLKDAELSRQRLLSEAKQESSDKGGIEITVESPKKKESPFSFLKSIFSGLISKLGSFLPILAGVAALFTNFKDIIGTFLQKTGKNIVKSISTSISKFLSKFGLDFTQEVGEKILQVFGKKTSQKLAQEAGEKVVKETVKGAGEKVVKETVEAAGEKVVKETVKGAGEKVVKETTEAAGEKVIKSTTKGMFGKFLGGSLKILGKLVQPVMSGVEFNNRINAGQTKTQAILGEGADLLGSFLGGLGGGTATGLATGGLGTGVGAVGGAAIGSTLLEGLVDWATGASKIETKTVMDNISDLVSDEPKPEDKDVKDSVKNIKESQESIKNTVKNYKEVSKIGEKASEEFKKSIENTESTAKEFKKESEKPKSIFSGIFDSLSSSFQGAVDFLGGLGNIFGEGTDQIKKGAMNTLKGGLVGLFKVLKEGDLGAGIEVMRDSILTTGDDLAKRGDIKDISMKSLLKHKSSNKVNMGDLLTNPANFLSSMVGLGSPISNPRLQSQSNPITTNQLKQNVSGVQITGLENIKEFMQGSQNQNNVVSTNLNSVNAPSSNVVNTVNYINKDEEWTKKSFYNS